MGSMNNVRIMFNMVTGSRRKVHGIYE